MDDVFSKGKRKDSDCRFLWVQTLEIGSLGALPKAADIELLLDILTFSQFISFRIGAVPSGQVPTSVIFS